MSILAWVILLLSFFCVETALVLGNLISMYLSFPSLFLHFVQVALFSGTLALSVYQSHVFWLSKAAAAFAHQNCVLPLPSLLFLLIDSKSWYDTLLLDFRSAHLSLPLLDTYENILLFLSAIDQGTWGGKGFYLMEINNSSLFSFLIRTKYKSFRSAGSLRLQQSRAFVYLALVAGSIPQSTKLLIHQMFIYLPTSAVMYFKRHVNFKALCPTTCGRTCPVLPILKRLGPISKVK